ncbi:hypothetical protein MBLNU459_g8124t1 [Dothideomycetes sp. NU459]
MSTAKRTRGRQSEGSAAPSLPPTKKAKTSQDTHASGLAFLTDENQRAGKRLQANLTNGVKDARSNRIDETGTVVANQAATPHEIIDISSGEESSGYEGSELDDEDEQAELDGDAPKALTNGTSHGGLDANAGADDAVMADVNDDDDDDDDDTAGPSFGDLLQASHPETIDVQAAFAEDRDAEAQALVSTGLDRILTAPSTTSLGTVLAQALRTNDRDLLESCFQLQDPASIRSTIQRLQSPLVANLLQRLAERVHKRPGRAGSLMVWIQWALVAHGGYLASQPEVLKKLKSLSQVIRERANGLNNLMVLKGKLDMLAAQIELRREMRKARGPQFDSDEEDPAVVYVEGQDDDRSVLGSDGEYYQKRRRPRPRGGRGRSNKANALELEDADSDDEDIDNLTLANGIAEHDDDSDEGEDEDAEGMFDDEAEETSDDEGEDLSEDDEDEDDNEEEQEIDETSASEDDSPPPVNPPKPQQRIRKR